MSEYAQRQYRLMKQFLEDFEKGSLSLRVLMDSLRGLLNVLQEENSEWRKSFRNSWWTLEQIYAVTLDREQSEVSQVDQEAVYEAVGDMKHLLSEVMLIDDPSQYY